MVRKFIHVIDSWDMKISGHRKAVFCLSTYNETIMSGTYLSQDVLIWLENRKTEKSKMGHTCCSLLCPSRYLEVLFFHEKVDIFLEQTLHVEHILYVTSLWTPISFSLPCHFLSFLLKLTWNPCRSYRCTLCDLKLTWKCNTLQRGIYEGLFMCKTCKIGPFCD